MTSSRQAAILAIAAVLAAFAARAEGPPGGTLGGAQAPGHGPPFELFDCRKQNPALVVLSTGRSLDAGPFTDTMHAWNGGGAACPGLAPDGLLVLGQTHCRCQVDDEPCRTSTAHELPLIDMEACFSLGDPGCPQQRADGLQLLSCAPAGAGSVKITFRITYRAGYVGQPATNPHAYLGVQAGGLRLDDWMALVDPLYVGFGQATRIHTLPTGTHEVQLTLVAGNPVAAAYPTPPQGTFYNGETENYRLRITSDRVKLIPLDGVAEIAARTQTCVLPPSGEGPAGGGD